MQGMTNGSCRTLAFMALSLLIDGTALAAGETSKRLGIKMVDIPAGSFTMGNCLSAGMGVSGNADAGCDAEADMTETPRRHVDIRAFQLGQTHVTLAQFRTFIAEAGRSDLLSEEFVKWNNQGDDAPVLMVNWDDAQDFVAWLNKVDGDGWRLPSEAEWEYACRAGRGSRYCGGDEADAVAWIGINSKGRQHPVGQKRPNAWGLYDMSGNAYVWLQDCVHIDYRGAPADGSAWTAGCNSDYRMVRGGSFESYANYTRTTYRSYFWSDFRNIRIGIRLARAR